MKKLLYMILIPVLFLSGCAKNTLQTPSADLFVMDGDITAAGISAGDGPEEFIDAYRDYPIQVAYQDQSSGYLTMSIEDIPYEDQISSIIAGLFIDGESVTEEAVCAENEIESSELPELPQLPFLSQKPRCDLPPARFPLGRRRHSRHYLYGSELQRNF